MKKIALTMLAAAITLSSTGKGFAQAPEKRMSISLGGGRSIPTGDFADG